MKSKDPTQTMRKKNNQTISILMDSIKMTKKVMLRWKIGNTKMTITIRSKLSVTLMNLVSSSTVEYTLTVIKKMKIRRVVNNI